MLEIYQSAGCGEIMTLKTDEDTYVRIENYDQSSDCTWVFKVSTVFHEMIK